MIEILDLGLVNYSDALKKQHELVAEIQKNRNRNVLILCEHPSVITIGRNGTPKNVVCHPGILKANNIDVVDIDRGGDVTLHNPGQLVGYPIFNLSAFKEDLHWFLRTIEQSIIDMLKVYNIDGHRMDGMTGVWVDSRRKICAMGLHCSRWVTSHGFALNVNNNLEEFSYIVPCGISDKGVGSIKEEVGTEVDIETVKSEVIKSFRMHFEK